MGIRVLILLTLGWAAFPDAAGFSGVAAGQTVPQLSGTLTELVAELTSPEYLLRAPAQDARPYADPSDALRYARRAAASVAVGDVEAAASMAEQIGYQLVDFYDTEAHRTYHLLREDLAKVGEPRGWGAYLFNPAPTVNAVIEAPHPLGDEHSAKVAAHVFAAGARGLMIAGAHRRKADLPDLVGSIFHQVHLAWTGGDFGAGRTPAIQVHGYADFRHDFPADTEVVLSTGGGQVTDTLTALNDGFDNAGFPAYVFNRLDPASARNRRVNGDEAGPRFWSLAATKNEQGKQTRGAGGEFVHIELESRVRRDATRRLQAAELIAATLAERLAIRSEPTTPAAPSVVLTSAEIKPNADSGIDTKVDVDQLAAAKPLGL